MSVDTESFPDGFNLGMVAAIPAHLLPKGAARYLQDVFIHRPGFTDRRGPVQSAVGVPAFTKKISGIFATYNPLGEYKIAALSGDASNGYLSVFSADYSTKTDIPFDSVFPSAPFRIVDVKPRLGGGAWIGVAAQYDSSAAQYLALWYGSDKPTYTAGTCTVTRGSTAVTGSGTGWDTQTAPGAFLFDNNGYLVGTVKRVLSATSLTLEKPALVAITGAAYSLKPFRGMSPRSVVGRITTDTASAVVEGTNTRFLDQGFNAGTWDFYKLSDRTFIGTVLSVTDNLTLTLTASATLALTDELYVAVKRDGDYNTLLTASKPGFLTAIYASRQWYANNAASADTLNRLWPADPDDPEGMNLVDGFFNSTSGSPQSISAPIKAIVAASNSMAVLTESEVYGVFGDSDVNFELRKIADEGTLSGMSAQTYQGDVIFAGRSGIFRYNGVGADNLTLATLGDFYKDCVKSFDPTVYRMWSAVDRDFYFLNIESSTPSITPIKGNVTSPPSRITVAIHLPTNAVTLLTNVCIQGAVTNPAQTGRGTWYVVNDSTRGWVCNLADLFTADGVDTITCAGQTAGPDLYIESAKLDFGDPLRKKSTKMFLCEYQVAGAALLFDTVIGLNNVGVTSSTSLPATAYTWDSLGQTYSTWDSLGVANPTWDSLSAVLFLPKRIRFQKASQHFAFRIYQQAATVTSARLGPFQIGFKNKRAGNL
jgi:hypothetical protein